MSKKNLLGIDPEREMDESIEELRIMKRKNTQAYPSVLRNNISGKEELNPGMTLRDYFAAKAMQGIIGMCSQGDIISEVRVAEISYEMADAMLKERSSDGK